MTSKLSFTDGLALRIKLSTKGLNRYFISQSCLSLCVDKSLRYSNFFTSGSCTHGWYCLFGFIRPWILLWLPAAVRDEELLFEVWEFYFLVADVGVVAAVAINISMNVLMDQFNNWEPGEYFIQRQKLYKNIMQKLNVMNNHLHF